MKTLSLSLLLTMLPLMAAAENFQRSNVESELTAEGARIDRFTIYSPSMDRDIKAVVVLPPAYMDNEDQTFPILYTLHGHAAPYDTWANMSKLRKQLTDMPFIYTCFDGDIGSYYIDAPEPINTSRDKEDETKQVSKFNTFFFEEFMPAIDSWYRTNGKRGVTGFSMGGAGALSYGLAHPEKFTAISGLSSAYLEFSDPESKSVERMYRVLGPISEYPERYDAVNHYKLIEMHLANGVKLPPIYQHIGTEDFLLDQNHEFRDFAEKQGLDLTYVESEGGHNWSFWHPASVEVAKFHWEHFQD